MQFGWTPLLYACSGGLLETVELLISKGADVNVRNNVRYIT